MPWSQAHVRVESSGQPPEQGDGGLGAALFDGLDFIDGHVSPAGQVGNAQTQGVALVVDRLAEGQCLADGDPCRNIPQPDPQFSPPRHASKVPPKQ